MLCHISPTAKECLLSVYSRIRGQRTRSKLPEENQKNPLDVVVDLAICASKDVEQFSCLASGERKSSEFLVHFPLEYTLALLVNLEHRSCVNILYLSSPTFRGRTTPFCDTVH